jgi:hypothetical protein
MTFPPLISLSVVTGIYYTETISNYKFGTIRYIKLSLRDDDDLSFE